jgi:50S ribosomal protein L16 3-hydroxylase
VTAQTELLAGDLDQLAVKASTGFALPDVFWSRFRAEHWEKRGTVLRQPFAQPLAMPDETFDGLVTASDRYRAGDPDIVLKFCIDHTMQLVDIGRYLPERADGTAEGYAERVTRMIDGRRFGLIVEEFQVFDAAFWLRLREFLCGLYEHTGLPRESSKATVFFGNYEHTPWGLHRGNSGNFQLIVDGPKRVRAWPDAFFRGKEDMTHRLDYERYNGDSIVLEGEPGDIIYWPSDYWHVGESVNGALSCAISVAMFIDQHSAGMVTGYSRGMVERRLARADRASPIDVRPARMGESPAALDDVVRRSIAALRDVSDDASLELRLRVAWLNHVTGFGFTSAPAPLPTQRLADDATVRALAEYPIVWLRGDNDLLICSANGHAFSVTASPRILALLERLNTGAPHRVHDLVEEHAGTAVAGGVEFESSPESIRALLEKLVGLRALELSSRSERDPERSEQASS